MINPLSYEQVMDLIDKVASGVKTWTIERRKAYDKLHSYLRDPRIKND